MSDLGQMSTGGANPLITDTLAQRYELVWTEDGGAQWIGAVGVTLMLTRDVLAITCAQLSGAKVVWEDSVTGAVILYRRRRL